MGKDGGKAAAAAKKAAALARKAAQQQAKAAKSSKKKAAKAGDDVEADEEDIETLLAQLQAADAKRTAVSVTVVERPTARANFSLTPLPSGELVLFGGEFYDGHANVCYNDLFRFVPGSGAGGSGGAGGEWRQVTSPTTPPHRCSHQAVLLPPARLLLMGGEFATANQFHHYNDTWSLDLPTNRWSRLESRKGPSARSGHRMAAWRGYVVLHGGFHQSASQDRWFGDLWLLDTRVGQWAEVTFPGTAMTPAPRSGHALATVPGRDVLLLYGGYSESKPGADDARSALAAGGRGGGKALTPVAAAAADALRARHSKAIVHTDLWLLRLGALATNAAATPAWERVRYVGAPPSPRLGFSLAMYRDRALLFGGVADADGDARGETIASQFFSDLYSYDVDRKRWFKLEVGAVRGGPAAGRRRRERPAAAAGAGGGASVDAHAAPDDDAVSLGSGDADDEDEAGAAGPGTGGAIDDNAFYYVDETGALVRVVDDGEDDADGGAAADGALAAADAGAGGGGPAGGATDDGEVGASAGRGPAAGGGDAAASAAAGASLVPPPSSSRRSRRQRGAADGDGDATPAALTSTAAASAAASAGPALVAAPAPTTPGATAVAPAGAASAPAAAPAPAPAGRMKAGLWVDGHWLHVFGGMFEGKQRETTLDDHWRVDLRDRGAWACLAPARPHEWRGDASDDGAGDEDEDDEDDEGGADDDDEDSGDSSDGGSDGGSDDAGAGGAGDGGGGGGSRFARGHGGAGGAGSSRENARLRQLRDQLGVEDAAVTPAPGEELRDFFARTGDAWVQRFVAGHHLAAGERIEGKQLRRRAFALARERYDAVWPSLVELYELEQRQRDAEEAANRRARASRGAGGAGGGGGGGRGTR